MAVVDKAVALVVRRRGEGNELLVFRQPFAGVQVPKGTVEDGEALTDAVMRELLEESGLAIECTPRPIGHWDRVLAGGEVQRWHLHLVEAPGDIPDQWEHIASGSVEEEGLTFAYHWLPVDDALEAALDPLFGECARRLVGLLAHPANR